MVLGAVFFGLRTAGMQIGDFRRVSCIWMGKVCLRQASCGRHCPPRTRLRICRICICCPLKTGKLVFSYNICPWKLYAPDENGGASFRWPFAISAWTWTEVLGSFLCAVHAALFAAVLFSFRNHPWAGSLWAVVVVIVLLWGENMAVFLDSRNPFPVFAAGFVEGGCLFLLFCGWETQPHSKKPPARPDVCLFCPLFAGT